MNVVYLVPSSGFIQVLNDWYGDHPSLVPADSHRIPLLYFDSTNPVGVEQALSGVAHSYFSLTTGASSVDESTGLLSLSFEPSDQFASLQEIVISALGDIVNLQPKKLAPALTPGYFSDIPSTDLTDLSGHTWDVSEFYEAKGGESSSQYNLR